MKLVPMKRQSAPEPDIHAAVAELESNLIALTRRRQFKVCVLAKDAEPVYQPQTLSANSSAAKITNALDNLRHLLTFEIPNADPRLLPLDSLRPRSRPKSQ